MLVKAVVEGAMAAEIKASHVITVAAAIVETIGVLTERSRWREWRQ